MKKVEEIYDIVIIGSGLGGLVSALILAKEGHKVCVLEKNAQIGGTLQTFFFDKKKFDTGVHYVGGLDVGQPLYPYFKYLGLLEALELEKMELNGFDLISFNGDENIYPIAQGYKNFKKQLLKFFPEEEKGLDKYISRIEMVCNAFALYNLEVQDNFSDEIDLFYESAKKVIEGCIQDDKLRAILAVHNILYAGEGDSAPFYVHALITDSYIKSSYRILGGGSKISNFLEKELRSHGGHIFRNSEVTKLNYSDQIIKSAELINGDIISGKTFISNIHPTQTFKLFDTSTLRKAYVNRVLSLENTTSAFVLYISLKPRKLKYRKVNLYYTSQEDVWSMTNYSPENWGKNFAVYFNQSKRDSGFADSLIIITYMRMDEVEKWTNSFNTTTNQSKRNSEYHDFREEKAQELITKAELAIPDIREAVNDFDVSTPLTLRDYIGADGSLYGIKKDYNSPLKSFINTRTKVPNLLLTGQNLVMHGVLGVTIGAIVTCSEILGRQYLINKIKESI